MKFNLFFISFISLLLFLSINTKADIGWDWGGYYFIDGDMNVFNLEFDIFNFYTYNSSETDHFGLLISSKFDWPFWQWPINYDTITETLYKIKVIYSLFVGFSGSLILFEEVYNISIGVNFKYFSKDIFISKNSCYYLIPGICIKMQNSGGSISIEAYIKDSTGDSLHTNPDMPDLLAYFVFSFGYHF